MKKAIQEAKTYQQKSYKTVKEKILERDGMIRQQYKKQYIEQL